MPGLIDRIAGERVEALRGAPRIIVDEAGWRLASNELAAGNATLLALGADAEAGHMAVLDDDERAILVASMPCRDGSYPSVGALHPPAVRLERAIRSLFGFEPVGLPDARP